MMEGSVYAFIAFYIALIIFMVVVYWKIFEKAGQPGWASIVPFYNTYVLIVNILQMPPIWFWLLLVPCANIVVLLILVFMIPFKLAEKFGKDTGFAIGLLLLGIIFLPILAFGDARYRGGRGRKRMEYYDEDEEDEDDDEDDRPRKKKKQRDDW
jgi:Family of unknown function (DUF5684)